MWNSYFQFETSLNCCRWQEQTLYALVFYVWASRPPVSLQDWPLHVNHSPCQTLGSSYVSLCTGHYFSVIVLVYVSFNFPVMKISLASFFLDSLFFSPTFSFFSYFHISLSWVLLYCCLLLPSYPNPAENFHVYIRNNIFVCST